MALTDYTTYADVRAALGVSDEELEDATLALTTYEDALVSEFEDISLTLQSTLDATLAKVTPTEDEERFLRYARLFSAYTVAKLLTASLPMFGPKTITDGKAKIDRFNDPYRDTVKDVAAQYDKWRSRLSAAFTALGQSSSTPKVRTYMSVVSPASDPVTGT
jgi:hypothetical protein